MKKILVIDDSALMRRVFCDIINSEERFFVEDCATNGLEALDLLSRKQYDAVVLDVNMPKMNGLELLKEMQKYKISARVLMASTDTSEGTKTTLEALELGALDFIHKPQNASDCRSEDFKRSFLEIVSVVSESMPPIFTNEVQKQEERNTAVKMAEFVKRHASLVTGKKIVAIACSTGGPKALQSVIPLLPASLMAPVLIVQHMPQGFTKALADRLNTLSELIVTEAAEGDILENGHVYLAMGGRHMNVANAPGGKYKIHYTDEPPREGVKPCANYMFESLKVSNFDEIICVVMTGMGADGTKGILHLKQGKSTFVIAQEQSTCAVYGMPKSIVNAGAANHIVPLDQIAQEIILSVGVK
ncbi:MAG TPA: chemotaxis-specific protein-glutamate methyltransferase CheB [Lachnospiraceae bacterium]|nr:chemotaxis-specific protein-glutamate methyltransferase CheB [Lachnospiraceae bacterium]